MPMKGSRSTALTTLNFSTKSYGGQRHAPDVLPQGKNSRYPLYKSLGGSRGRLDGSGKSSPHRGSNPVPSSPHV